MLNGYDPKQHAFWAREAQRRQAAVLSAERAGAHHRSLSALQTKLAEADDRLRAMQADRIMSGGAR